VPRIKSSTLLLLLILGDIAFLILHLIHVYSGWGSVFESDRFLLERDRGFGEFFQYLKLFSSVLILVAMGVRKRSLLYLSWSALFSYFLLDDSLKIHETFGLILAKSLILKGRFGLRPVDFGELAVSFTFGFLLFGLILIAYLMSDPDGKRFSKWLFILVAILVFFGIFLDMLDIILFGEGTSFLNVIENWGEMLVVSLMTWFVYKTFLSHTSKPR